MALPFEPKHRKFKLASGDTVVDVKPSYDDWDHTTSFAEDYLAGTSLQAGLEGRAVSLDSHGPSGENNNRQYHVDESREHKREKRQKARRRIRPR